MNPTAMERGGVGSLQAVIDRIGPELIIGHGRGYDARDIDLTYAEDGRSLRFAKLVENGVVQLPAAGKTAGRRVAGNAIDIALAPDGTTVTNLNASDKVQVDLPAEGDLPAKRITSELLVAEGTPEKGLQQATFAENVEYRETRAAQRNGLTQQELRDVLTQVVAAQRPRWRSGDPAQVELWALEVAPRQFRLGVRVTRGATFVLVSGLAGQSIRNQDRCLPTSYPYGCKGEWASIYTSDQNARYGALFIEFNVDGDPNKARGYFKDVGGRVVDQFTVTSQP